MSACEKCGYDPAATITGRWSMFIERKVPTLNDHLVNSGRGRWRYRDVRDTWQVDIMVARANSRVPSAVAKRRLTLVRVFSGREQWRDFDNLAGGMKPIIDALALERVILDDSPAHVELYYQQERSEDRSGLRILVEELAA